MKTIVITTCIATLAFISGCAVPRNPALRIAISPSPGSAIFYIAQKAGLFTKYNVAVQIVELNTGCECCLAICDGNVDAVVMPFKELEVLEKSGATASIVMVVANPLTKGEESADDLVSQNWEHDDFEILVGNRTDLMRRRQEWQRVLLAFEHARLLLAGEPEVQLAVVAKREHRSNDSVIKDMKKWKIFGVASQDSLFGSEGLYSRLSAKWHGRQFLTSAAVSKLNGVVVQDEATYLGHKVR